MKDIAIVGAGPAGYSAAITARKRDKSIVVIGQNTGWLAHAHSIANYPGLPDISGRDLLSAMANQAQALGADCVLVSWGHNDLKRLESAGLPVAHSVEALENILAKS